MRSKLSLSIYMLSQHPLAVESRELVGGSPAGEQAMLAAVGHWAELNPAAAADWLIKLGKTHQELQRDDLKQSILEGVALVDPRQAFTMLDLLKPEDVSAGVRAIVEMALRSPEPRDDTLAALREHLGRLTREADRVVIREHGFAALARSPQIRKAPQPLPRSRGSNRICSRGNEFQMKVFELALVLDSDSSI